jgi:hypothetical protein
LQAQVARGHLTEDEKLAVQERLNPGSVGPEIARDAGQRLLTERAAREGELKQLSEGNMKAEEASTAIQGSVQQQLDGVQQQLAKVQGAPAAQAPRSMQSENVAQGNLRRNKGNFLPTY